MHGRLALVAAFLAACILGHASAVTAQQVVYDTYVFGDTNPDRQVGGANSTQWADPFLLSVGGAEVELRSLRLRLRTTPLVNPGTDVVVRFREDAGGVPGPVLESWIVPTGLTSLTDVDLVSTVQPLLTDGGVYWINVAPNSDANFAIWASSDTNTLAWLYANSRDVDPTWLAPPPDALFGLALARVEVPEPSPAWQAAASVLLLPGLLALRRRLTR